MVMSVWDALFDDKEEALNLKIRSELMATISKYIRENGLKQVEAAEIFGIKQPRVSDIIQGKIDKFSIDTLVNILAKTDAEIEVSIKDKSVARTTVDVISEHPWGGHEVFYRDGRRKRVAVVRDEWADEIEISEPTVMGIG